MAADKPIRVSLRPHLLANQIQRRYCNERLLQICTAGSLFLNLSGACLSRKGEYDNAMDCKIKNIAELVNHIKSLLSHVFPRFRQYGYDTFRHW